MSKKTQSQVTLNVVWVDGKIDREAVLVDLEANLSAMESRVSYMSGPVPAAIKSLFDTTSKGKFVLMTEVYHKMLSAGIITIEKGVDSSAMSAGVEEHLRANSTSKYEECESGAKEFITRKGPGGGYARWVDLTEAEKASFVASNAKKAAKAKSE